MIIHNHDLAPEMKENALSLLGSIDTTGNDTITGGQLVGQAIATGKSAAAGAAVGFLTAKALGLPTPRSAAIVGAVSNTLGPGLGLLTAVLV